MACPTPSGDNPRQFLMDEAPKILCIVFKYLGDVVVSVPAIRSLKAHWPQARLHLLVAEDALPLVRHLPWIERAWGFPRQRGSMQLRRSWPVVRALRRERFDRSVDFIGNDRGAIVSLLAGARQRLAPASPLGFLGRRWCYHTVAPCIDHHHWSGPEVLRVASILESWGVPPPASAELEVHADPALAAEAARLMPKPALVFHLSTSQPKKEWPVPFWAGLCRQARAAGLEFVLSSGPTPREQGLITSVRAALASTGAPPPPALPLLERLDVFLAVLARARAMVCGDTGPLHFAAGLGVPTVALFGPTYAHQWAPRGRQHRLVRSEGCICSGHAHICTAPEPCISRISPEAVWDALNGLLASPC